MLAVVWRALPDSFWIRWVRVGTHLVRFFYSENSLRKRKEGTGTKRGTTMGFTSVFMPGPHTAP